MDEARGYIGQDDKEYRVIITKNRGIYGKYIIVLDEEEKEIYRRDWSEINPWKVLIGDIDGDGIEDISIGVYKESPFHPIMAKRPFIYNFKDGRLIPKWRGSRLSRPFVDYVFYDLDKDGIDEIVSIEILENDKKLINSYKWKGFGFEGFVETKEYDDIIGISIEDGSLYVDYVKREEVKKGILELEGGELLIKGEE